MTLSHSARFYKKTISSHYLDRQKENGLLSTYWTFDPKDYSVKQGVAGHLMLLTILKKKFEDFLVI